MGLRNVEFQETQKSNKASKKKTFKICFEDKLKGGRLKREQEGHLIG